MGCDGEGYDGGALALTVACYTCHLLSHWGFTVFGFPDCISHCLSMSGFGCPVLLHGLYI